MFQNNLKQFILLTLISFSVSVLMAQKLSIRTFPGGQGFIEDTDGKQKIVTIKPDSSIGSTARKLQFRNSNPTNESDRELTIQNMLVPDYISVYFNYSEGYPDVNLPVVYPFTIPADSSRAIYFVNSLPGRDYPSVIEDDIVIESDSVSSSSLIIGTHTSTGYWMDVTVDEIFSSGTVVTHDEELFPNYSGVNHGGPYPDLNAVGFDLTLENLTSRTLENIGIFYYSYEVINGEPIFKPNGLGNEGHLYLATLPLSTSNFFGPELIDFQDAYSFNLGPYETQSFRAINLIDTIAGFGGVINFRSNKYPWYTVGVSGIGNRAPRADMFFTYRNSTFETESERTRFDFTTANPIGGDVFFTVESVGELDLELSDPYVPWGFTIKDFPDAPIPPGESAPITLGIETSYNFYGLETEYDLYFSGEFGFNTNAPRWRDVDYDLLFQTDRDSSPELEIGSDDPDLLNNNTISFDSTEEDYTFDITNNGNTILLIEGFVIPDGVSLLVDGQDPFSLSYPLLILPGNSITLTVSIDANASKGILYQGALEIVTNNGAYDRNGRLFIRIKQDVSGTQIFIDSWIIQ